MKLCTDVALPAKPLYKQTFSAVSAPRSEGRVASAAPGTNPGFSAPLTKLLERHLPMVAIRTIALGITTIWNFYLYKTPIFKISAEELLG